MMVMKLLWPVPCQEKAYNVMLIVTFLMALAEILKAI